jgi:hypothetical protein
MWKSEEVRSVSFDFDLFCAEDVMKNPVLLRFVDRSRSSFPPNVILSNTYNITIDSSLDFEDTRSVSQ